MLHADGHRGVPAELLDGRQPARPGRRRGPPTCSAADRFMWGSDYPHDEGTYPFTREHLRQIFPGVEPEELRQILAGQRGQALRLRPRRAWRRSRAAVGPTVDELAQPLTELPDEPQRRAAEGRRPRPDGLRRHPGGSGVPGRGPGVARAARPAARRRRPSRRRDDRRLLRGGGRATSRSPRSGRRRCTSTAGPASPGPRSTAAAAARRCSSAIFNQEQASFDVPAGVFAQGIGMAGPTIIAHGTDEQKERFLRPMLRGDEVWCQLFSEPGAGSDLAGLSHPRRARRRRVRRQRAEGVDVERPLQRLGHPARPHRLRRAQAPRHHLLPRRHDARPASRSGRCARSPARRTSTRCSSPTCASRRTTSSAASTVAGASTHDHAVQRAHADRRRRRRARSPTCSARPALRPRPTIRSSASSSPTPTSGVSILQVPRLAQPDGAQQGRGRRARRAR